MKEKSIETLRKGIGEIDRDMVGLFEKRMALAREIGLEKAKLKLPVHDPGREEELIEKNIGYLNDKNLLPYYLEFQKKIFDLSRSYQENNPARGI